MCSIRVLGFRSAGFPGQTNKISILPACLHADSPPLVRMQARDWGWLGQLTQGETALCEGLRTQHSVLGRRVALRGVSDLKSQIKAQILLAAGRGLPPSSRRPSQSRGLPLRGAEPRCPPCHPSFVPTFRFFSPFRPNSPKHRSPFMAAP